ncbi:TPA: hypothetical protein ACGSTL_001415 [Vibrio parahaemolyticus]
MHRIFETVHHEHLDPRFFSDRDKALEFAFEAIKQVHPELKGVNFSKYEEDEDNSIV